jgi:hypothetical protein
MGQAVRGSAGNGREGRDATARTVKARRARAARLWWTVVVAFTAFVHAIPAQPPELLHLQEGRFLVVAAPRDARLARTFLQAAQANDTFPGLRRPVQRVRIDVAVDEPQFRALVGPSAPEWGAAVAFPRAQRIIMQGSFAGSAPGLPAQILRHELAHLALHEAMGELPPRWFDEGYASYAAGEWGREETLATNFVLVMRGVPTLDSLDRRFYAGSGQAEGAYALAHAAVAELAALDQERGLTLFFDHWRDSRQIDPAIRAAYGLTLAGFERRWQSQMRRRYGALALFADLAIVGAGVLALLVPLHRAQRRRRRQRLALLKEVEAASERAERERALEELVAEGPAGAPAPNSQDPTDGRVAERGPELT